ncbi:MAG: TonB-dependent receptor, partial [Bacteroidota bacterium]
KKSTGESIIGFRFSGQYQSQLDDDPAATPVFRVRDDVLAELIENPIITLRGSSIPAGEFLRNEDVERFSFRQNEERTSLNLTGKIDIRITNNIDMTFSGGYVDTRNRFTPASSWRLLNTQNNPYSDTERIRGNVRFRHRLGRGPVEGEENKSVIRNASYILQFGYEKYNFLRQDHRHEDRFFDYGYVGQFDYEWIPVAGQVDPELELPFNIGHVGYLQSFQGYTPGDINPGLANYNNNVDQASDVDFIARNGFTSSTFSNVWQLHTNVNTVYNRYDKRDNDIYTFTASSTFDLAPGGSDKGVHNISFGLFYEQRFNRGYGIRPRALWNVARLQANDRHINGVNTDDVIGMFDSGIPIVGEVPLYATRVDDLEGLLFYKRVREVTGDALGDFVNVDGLSPDQLSLDMFSAGELNDAWSQVRLGYWGFDYLGNKLSDDVGFDDFFTAEANGVRTFPVAAQKPIYSAAYIQDKFTFRDIIFRVGLRVDRYDANTKVLKDPYSLYEIQTASEFFSQQGGEKPGSIGDDFKVYVESESSNTVK